MRRLTWLVSASSLLLVASVAFAQAPEETQEQEPAGEEEWTDEEEQPRLRPPAAESLQLGSTTTEEQTAEEPAPDEEGEGEPAASAGDEEEEELPSPEQAQARLDRAMPNEASNPTRAQWTTPQTVVELHGYMRFRGNFQDNFFFNRQNTAATYENQVSRGAILPFAAWIPAEDQVPYAGPNGPTVMGGCGATGGCDQNALAYANMRLRLEPTVNLSDDVRVRMQLDVFDNMVLGSTPNSYAVGAAGLPVGTTNMQVPNYIDPYYRYERTTFAPIDTLTTTLASPQYGVNSLQDSVRVRRAWAEVRNRGLGELRFGRMGRHWGLGILANGGSGIDSDYQTDVDTVMLSTRLAGINFFGAWDFAGEGLLYQEPADIGGIPFDRSRIDDIEQFAVGAAYRATQEEQTASLARGDAVFNAGVYGVYRNQNLSSSGTTNPFGLCVICNTNGMLTGTVDSTVNPSMTDTSNQALRQFGNAFFVRRGANIFTVDLWAQFLFEKLRLEIRGGRHLRHDRQHLQQSVHRNGRRRRCHAAAGRVRVRGRVPPAQRPARDLLLCGLRQRRPGSGGLLRALAGFNPQVAAGPAGVRNNTYSTFYMHPNYRIDSIFWRT